MANFKQGDVVKYSDKYGKTQTGVISSVGNAVVWVSPAGDERRTVRVNKEDISLMDNLGKMSLEDLIKGGYSLEQIKSQYEKIEAERKAAEEKAAAAKANKEKEDEAIKQIVDAVANYFSVLGLDATEDMRDSVQKDVVKKMNSFASIIKPLIELEKIMAEKEKKPAPKKSETYKDVDEILNDFFKKL